MFYLLTLKIFASYFCGFLVSAMIKMGDINRSDNTPANSFKEAWQLYWAKEWRSWSVSLLVGVFYSFTHEQWVDWISNSKYTADTILVSFTKGIYILSFVLAMVITYLGYKFIFGKLAK